MESLFICLSGDFKIDAYDWFCGPGSHMYDFGNTIPENHLHSVIYSMQFCTYIIPKVPKYL